MSLTKNTSKSRTSHPAEPGFRPRTAADQLPRPPQEERHVVRGLLALVGVLLLVVGVPALLVVFVGNPLPTSLPDRSWLTADVTATALINIFAVLCWLVWAHFVVCLVAEIQSLRQGRLPHLVPLGGGTQLVARRLAAGVLLLAGSATMSGIVPTTASSDTAVVSTDSGTAQQQSAAPDGSAPAESATRTGASAAYGAADAATQREAEAEADVVKFYEVKPRQGRNYDTLWDISERTMGDPFRYKEVFALNRDRSQPDGRSLVDADLIQPGWQLIMPADATGPDIQTRRVSVPTAPGSQNPAQAPAKRGAAEGAVTGLSQPSGAQSGVSDAGGSDTVIDVVEADGTVEGTGLGDLGLGGGLVLAGLALALSTRRGSYGTPAAPEQALRLAGNPGRADLLDRALRILAEARAGQGEPLPDVSAVYVNDEQVVVHLAGRASSPPAPWTCAEDGQSWMLAAADIEGMRAGGPAPWPGLVAIAESHGYDLLIDLEHAPGMISVGGDAEVAREVALSAVADLVTHPWSDGVDVSLVGFGTDLSDLAPQRIRHLDTIEDAVDEARSTTSRSRDLLRSLGVDGVLAGRAAGHGGALRPHVLVLSGTPGPEQSKELGELIAQGRSGLSAICVGASLAARWRFTADAAGSVDLGALGLSGTARRLRHQDVAQVREWLREADRDASTRNAEAAALSPDAAVQAMPASGAAHLSRAERMQDADRATVTVGLLGPVQVQASGPVTAGRVALLTELTCLVALHPDGVHASVLRVALWPRGVEDDVVSATLEAAQRWLGADADGQQVLHQDEQGRWRLGPAAHVDWLELVAVTARHGADPGRVTRTLCSGRGPAFSGVPAGRYTWLAFHQAARDARVLVTAAARRTTAAHLAGGDVSSADRTLRAALTLVPGAQPLWRDLVRLWGDRDPGTTAAVAEEMQHQLFGAPVEPETAALMQHLLPDRPASG